MCKKESATVSKYTWDEVKQHNVAEDAWVVYHNKVYDVSNWMEHPGGGVIFTHAGDDMTDIFAAFHAPGSQALIRKFYIGDLIVESNETKTQHQIAFEKAYRDLRAKMIVMGLFKSSKLYYVYKVMFNMGMWLSSVLLVKYFGNVWAHMASAIILGFFWQQSGWLAHDFLHHQVFQYRKYGDLMGIFLGNVMQGYSMQWWKNKHNGHHAVPNLHCSSIDTLDGDPDIDTMPVLAWSKKHAESYGKDSKLTNFLIKWQAYTYFPILLLARLNWLNESFKTAYSIGYTTANAEVEMKARGLQFPMLERIGIAIHYLWVLIVSTGFGTWGIGYSLFYFLVATCCCGLNLALAFGLGHNGMATYDAETRPDFWKLQVTTTRNVIGGHGIPQWFVNWYCGGLQYQVDHHLFPTLPRHNLPKANKLIKGFCKEWNVGYHEADMVDGTIEVLSHLSKVSHHFVNEFLNEFPAM